MLSDVEQREKAQKLYLKSELELNTTVNIAFNIKGFLLNI